MPFDVMPDTTTPSLERLSYLLRHKELWPAGFEWDYSDCRTCAMGLAVQVWQMSCEPYPEELARPLGLSGTQAGRIFTQLHLHTDDMWGMRAITPRHVADAIDAILARRRRRSRSSVDRATAS